MVNEAKRKERNAVQRLEEALLRVRKLFVDNCINAIYIILIIEFFLVLTQTYNG